MRPAADHTRAGALIALALAAAAVPGTARAWCRTRTRLPAVCYDARGMEREDCAQQLQNLFETGPEQCGVDESTTGAPTCAAQGRLARWNRACVGFSFHGEGPPEAPDLEALAPVFTAAAARWHGASDCADESGAAAPAWLRVERLCVADAGCPASGPPLGYDRTGPNANTVSFDREWRPDAMHLRDVIALTTTFFDTTTGEILDADMTLNSHDFVFVGARPPGDARTAAGLAWVATHEFGHFIGLAHSTCRRAIMWYSEVGPGAAPPPPLTDDDRGALCAAYDPAAPLANATCSWVPYGGLAADRGGARLVGGCRARPTGRADQRDARWSLALCAAVVIVMRGRARSARAARAPVGRVSPRRRRRRAAAARPTPARARA